MTRTLWIVQALLALIFVFSGVSKFVMSVDEMNAQAAVPLPGLFLHFIGVCEVLGAIGLILPVLVRIRPELTRVAAAGLLIIMIGATVLTLAGGQIALAMIPLVVGLLVAFVVFAHWRRMPSRPST
jgi:uncharacterized membrane protein YphA (DoxX/SURF4 family)